MVYSAGTLSTTLRSDSVVRCIRELRAERRDERGCPLRLIDIDLRFIFVSQVDIDLWVVLSLSSVLRRRTHDQWPHTTHGHIMDDDFFVSSKSSKKRTMDDKAAAQLEQQRRIAARQNAARKFLIRRHHLRMHGTRSCSLKKNRSSSGSAH